MEFSRQEYWSGLPFPSLEDMGRDPICYGDFMRILRDFGNISKFRLGTVPKGSAGNPAVRLGTVPNGLSGGTVPNWLLVK